MSYVLYKKSINLIQILMCCSKQKLWSFEKDSSKHKQINHKEK